MQQDFGTGPILLMDSHAVLVQDLEGKLARGQRGIWQTV